MRFANDGAEPNPQLEHEPIWVELPLRRFEFYLNRVIGKSVA
jgi:hypothetical protein